MARILVIDDEDRIRRLLRAVLEMEGHEIIEASQGDEALRLHRATPAQLVITDIVMPEKDGLEVMMALRREAHGPMVIVMSAGSRFMLMETLELAKPLGAFAVLRKPFELGEMIETVRRALAA